jgi:hypothetical protein
MVGVAIVSVAGYVYSLDAKKHLLHSSFLPSVPIRPLSTDPGNANLISNYFGPFSELETVRLALTAEEHSDASIMVLSTTMLACGVVLTLLSQVSQALQFISEEIMVGSTNLHPLQIIAVEGTLSTILSAVCLGLGTMLPGKDEGGHIETLPDTFKQLENSMPLFLLCLGHFLGIGGGNFFGLRVSSVLPHAHATLLCSCFMLCHRSSPSRKCMLLA